MRWAARRSVGEILLIHVDVRILSFVFSTLAQNTLFRGNTVLTKTMELAMNWFGKSFLEASVGPVIRQLVSKEVMIEVDPVRSGRGQKDQERNVDLLVFWCNEFWKHIYSKREECPQCVLFYMLRVKIITHFIQRTATAISSHSSASRETVRESWQPKLAMAECFCLLFPSLHCPVYPTSSSLWLMLWYVIRLSSLQDLRLNIGSGMPPPAVQRSLTLIAKVLQSLANLNPVCASSDPRIFFYQLTNRCTDPAKRGVHERRKNFHSR